MLRETSAEIAISGGTAGEVADPDEFFRLNARLRRLLERVALPRRWSRDDVRDVQKALKDALRELDRQAVAFAKDEGRGPALLRARAALSMSPASVPTPAWYLCLLAACESLQTDPGMRRSN